MSLLRRILVPLDGSGHAEAALAWAAPLAERARAQLFLVRVAEVPAVPDLDLRATYERAAQEATAYLERVAAPLRAKGLTVECAVLPGDLGRGHAIVHYALDNDISLIVMVVHRGAYRENWVYGPVVDHVLRQARMPVCLVDHDTRPPERLAAPRPVVVPLDGSILAEMALPWGVTIACLAGSRLLLLQAIEEAASHEETASRVAAAQRYLHDVAALARREAFASLEVIYTTRLGPPGSVITAYAAEVKAHVIVIASHGEGASTSLSFGSTTEEVLRDATVPVLLVRARRLEAEHAAPPSTRA